MKGPTFLKLAGIATAILMLGALSGGATVGAQASRTAGGSAFGVQLGGPVPLEATPTVEASASGEAEETTEDSLVHVPADPVAESFTALVQAGGSGLGTLDARLQAVVEGATETFTTGWNGRGYAVTEDLVALAGNLEAQVIESESLAGCVGGQVVYGSASRVVGLTLGGEDVPVPNPSPNQALIDQGGIKIVLWETNWDPETGGTTDGEATVWTNALHVTAPGGVDLIVSHSEASADCAPEASVPLPPEVLDEHIPEAPPAAAVEEAPNFTG